ncbi:hypothetical protein K491DRAFT_699134 [Lophiostoma macrostomum CBS 122681]|uniref:Uncharacterized protein n=1 Tax=Lophiostoma macrostomum CBS 122681 TaxID=1314788 RepID=A0A6A6SME5_9PLEO|nr:hypothetical protein K491DRAFT_699134 [Lophiostoma macrostomum CBS 122681]
MWFCQGLSGKQYCEKPFDPAKQDCAVEGPIEKTPRVETCAYCWYYLQWCMSFGHHDCFEWTCKKGPVQCKSNDCHDVQCILR